MTVQIKKSAADRIPAFGARVAAHAADLRHWRAHMKKVEADAANPDIPTHEKHAPFGAPVAAPLIDSAVNADDEIDFEIVDDGPTPEQVLAAKKIALINQVGARETAAIDELLPPGKRRFHDMRETDIRLKDNVVAHEAVEKSKGFLNAVKAKLGVETVDINDAVLAARSDADTRHLEEQEDRRRKLYAIQRLAAQAQHDIEDLTLDNIDAWQMPDFKV